MKSILLIVAIVLTASIFTGCSKPTTPEATLKEFLKRVEKNDISATELLQNGIKSDSDRENFERNISASSSKIKEQGGIKEIIIRNVDINDDRAKVYYTIVFNNGEEEKDARAKLTKENGEWKLNN